MWGCHKHLSKVTPQDQETLRAYNQSVVNRPASPAPKYHSILSMPISNHTYRTFGSESPISLLQSQEVSHFNVQGEKGNDSRRGTAWGKRCYVNGCCVHTLLWMTCLKWFISNQSKCRYQYQLRDTSTKTPLILDRLKKKNNEDCEKWFLKKNKQILKRKA